MHFLSHLRRRILAGSNCPDRLIRYNNFSCLIRFENGKDSIQLPAYDIGSLARFAFRQSFPYANDRRQASAQCALRLVCNHLVIFAMIGASFGVADNDKAALKIQQHPRRYFSCIGADAMCGNVLRPPSGTTVCQLILALGQVGERRANRDIAILFGGANLYLFQQNRIGNNTAVHFPVTNNELATDIFHNSGS